GWTLTAAETRWGSGLLPAPAGIWVLRALMCPSAGSVLDRPGRTGQGTRTGWARCTVPTPSIVFRGWVSQPDVVRPHRVAGVQAIEGLGPDGDREAQSSTVSSSRGGCRECINSRCTAARACAAAQLRPT